MTLSGSTSTLRMLHECYRRSVRTPMMTVVLIHFKFAIENRKTCSAELLRKLFMGFLKRYSSYYVLLITVNVDRIFGETIMMEDQLRDTWENPQHGSYLMRACARRPFETTVQQATTTNAYRGVDNFES